MCIICTVVFTTDACGHAHSQCRCLQLFLGLQVIQYHQCLLVLPTEWTSLTYPYACVHHYNSYGVLVIIYCA